MHPTRGQKVIYRGQPAMVAFCSLNFVMLELKTGEQVKASYSHFHQPMKLNIINTGSQGNAYVLTDSQGDMLLLDCGVNFDLIKQAINFNYKQLKGCLLTHEHGDHAKSALNLIDSAIDVYTSLETATALHIDRNVYFKAVKFGNVIQVPNSRFKFQAVPLFHDVPCFGYLVSHPEMGNLLFATDTAKLPYKFKDVKTYLIEANYCEEILEQKNESGNGNVYVNERVKNSHLSIQQALKCLEISDNTKTEQIILIHLSDRNSDEVRFVEMVEKATGKPTICANKNTVVELAVF